MTGTSTSEQEEHIVHEGFFFFCTLPRTRTLLPHFLSPVPSFLKACHRVGQVCTSEYDRRRQKCAAVSRTQPGKCQTVCWLKIMIHDWIKKKKKKMEDRKKERQLRDWESEIEREMRGITIVSGVTCLIGALYSLRLSCRNANGVTGEVISCSTSFLGNERYSLLSILRNCAFRYTHSNMLSYTV